MRQHPAVKLLALRIGGLRQGSVSPGVLARVLTLLWKERNNRTFDRRARSAREFQAAVGNEIVMWIQGGFKSLQVEAVVTNRFLGRLVSSFPNA